MSPIREVSRIATKPKLTFDRLAWDLSGTTTLDEVASSMETSSLLLSLDRFRPALREFSFFVFPPLVRRRVADSLSILSSTLSFTLPN